MHECTVNGALHDRLYIISHFFNCKFIKNGFDISRFTGKGVRTMHHYGSVRCTLYLYMRWCMEGYDVQFKVVFLHGAPYVNRHNNDHWCMFLNVTTLRLARFKWCVCMFPMHRRVLSFLKLKCTIHGACYIRKHIVIGAS